MQNVSFAGSKKVVSSARFSLVKTRCGMRSENSLRITISNETTRARLIISSHAIPAGMGTVRNHTRLGGMLNYDYRQVAARIQFLDLTGVQILKAILGPVESWGQFRKRVSCDLRMVETGFAQKVLGGHRPPL